MGIVQPPKLLPCVLSRHSWDGGFLTRPWGHSGDWFHAADRHSRDRRPSAPHSRDGFSLGFQITLNNGVKVMLKFTKDKIIEWWGEFIVHCHIPDSLVILESSRKISHIQKSSSTLVHNTRGGREHWNVNYIGTQSYIITPSTLLTNFEYFH